MGLFDSVFSGGQGNAGADMSASYDEAKNYMRPYYDNGLQDYNTYRGNVSDRGAMLDAYGNPAAYMWSQAGLSPYEAYQNLMAGYTQSPQAQYQTSQMQKAADRGASASGMLGSGSYFDALQRNQQDIIAQDQDRWLQNQMGVGQQQMGQLQNFQGQQNDYLNRMSGLANMGYNAANQMGQYAIGQGQANAMASLGQGAGIQDAIGQGLSFLGGNKGLMNSVRSIPGIGGFF